jgi:lipoic acid synthetase
LDPREPAHVSRAVAAWGLDYVVLTSVDRDDLEDQGAAHVAECVSQLKKRTGGRVLVEVLAGDFQGHAEKVEAVARSGLDVFAHNVETVRRTTPRVRDRRAGYDQSLGVLRAAKAADRALITKTSIMLGVGEREEEIEETLQDLRDAEVDVVTFGQYLRPSRRHMKVDRYVTPEEFARWQARAEEMGFKYCASGPMVRSSYKAGEFFLANLAKERRAEAGSAAAGTGA